MSNDAISRVGTYFPTRSLASFWIVANLIINGQLVCDNQSRQLVIAIMVIFAILVIFSCFTDTYTASNNQSYIVLLMPLYGPICFSLPSDYDKDRVYEFFYLKTRDYVHAFLSMAAFLLIVIFINPISICLFPASSSDPNGSGSRLSTSIIRTLPVLISVILGLAMMCLGPPRQMIGNANCEETCPREKLEEQMGTNPMFGTAPRPSMPNQRAPPQYQQQYGGQMGPPPPMGPPMDDNEGGYDDSYPQQPPPQMPHPSTYSHGGMPPPQSHSPSARNPSVARSTAEFSQQGSYR